MGIVASKGAFTVKVDIGTNDYAILNLLAFEGATKKNRPDVNVSVSTIIECSISLF